MILYRADYIERTVNEDDPVGNFYALSLKEVRHWARTQLTGAEDGDEVEIEKLEVTQCLSPRKLMCACLNQAGWCKSRIFVTRFVRENGRTVLSLQKTKETEEVS